MLGVGLRLAAERRAFHPRQLFAGGVAGGWYDPGAPGALFADTAATSPAVPDGPVARMRDGSGRGNDVTQDALGARPVLRRDAGGQAWLELDGSDDFLASMAPELRIVGDLTIVVAVERGEDGRHDIWASAQTGAAVFNQFEFRTEPGGELEFVASGTGDFELERAGAAGRVAVGGRRVLSAVRAGGQLRLDAGAGEAVAAHGTVPASDPGSEFRLGGRKGSPLFARGRLFGALVIARALRPAELKAARMFLGAKAGVTEAMQ